MKIKLITILLMILLLVGCGQNSDTNTGKPSAGSENAAESSNTESTSSEAASQEPYIVTFEATTLEDEAFTSDRFADSKLTMLNVWATYCNPCLNEMPDLGEIAAEYDPAEFQMVGIVSDVSVFDEADAIEEVKSIVEETKATTYSHLLLNQSLYENLVGGVSSVPTTFFVNQQGELLGYLVGSQTKANWEGIINDLLAQME